MSVSLSQILGVALVLAIVYYTLSLIVSTLTQYILDVFETRGKIMEEFLQGCLVGYIEKKKPFLVEWLERLSRRETSNTSSEEDETSEEGNIFSRLKKLPQINALHPVRYKYGGLGILTGSTKLSAHIERISAQDLVEALFDLSGTVENRKDEAIKVIKMIPDNFAMPNGEVSFKETKEKLTGLVEEGAYNINEVYIKLEALYENILNLASQEFKARARQIVILLSFAIAFLLGVDTIELAQRAWRDPSLVKIADAQAALIVEATKGGNETQKAKAEDDIQELFKNLETLEGINIPFWKAPESTNSDETLPWLFWRILGIALTGLAVSQGSSFWYDIIRQIKGEGSSSREEDPNARELARIKSTRE